MYLIPLWPILTRVVLSQEEALALKDIWDFLKRNINRNEQYFSFIFERLPSNANII